MAGSPASKGVNLCVLGCCLVKILSVDMFTYAAWRDLLDKTGRTRPKPDQADQHCHSACHRKTLTCEKPLSVPVPTIDRTLGYRIQRYSDIYVQTKQRHLTRST